MNKGNEPSGFSAVITAKKSTTKTTAKKTSAKVKSTVNSAKVEVNEQATSIFSAFTTNLTGAQDVAQKLQTQLISQKLLAFYKENMSFDTKEVSYEDFIKEVYK